MFWKYILFGLLVCSFLVIGCVTNPQSSLGSPATSLTPVGISETPLPPTVIQGVEVILQETRTIPKNEQYRWRLSLSTGQRVVIDIVTDGTAVDFVMLNLTNYEEFETAFVSKSGSLWDEYVILKTNITKERVEVKVPRTGNYYFVIENADIIPGGMQAIRDVAVTIKISTLD